MTDDTAGPTGSPAESPTEGLVRRLAALPTAAISDALDALGLPGQVHGLAPLTNQARGTGPAFTVAYEPAHSDRDRVGDFLDDVPAGSVVLIDNAGRTDCTVWGGIMTQTAGARCVAGTVIHGACRDVATSVAQGYPLFSAGRFMRTGKDRVRLAAVGVPITIDRVTICPGDLVTGDADGVVIVASRHLQRTVEIAEDIDRTEHRIVDAVRAGATLRQARAALGYHQLQRGTR